MEASGVRIDVATNHLGIVGVSEAFSVVPSLWRTFKSVRSLVASKRPDAAVLIGNDVFNVLLARWFRARGVPTSTFFPPQVWIWGAVAPVIVRSFDAVFTCFPEEQEVYGRAARATETDVAFVGHFLADRLGPRSDEDISRARGRFGLESSARVVCIMPGSRHQELRGLSPLLFAAARELVDRDGGIRIVVPVAQAQFKPAIQTEISRMNLDEFVVFAETGIDALRASDMVIMPSGTASLEAALVGVPMVVVYTVATVTHLIVRAAIRLGLIEVDRVALPNLLLERQVVPEFQQGEVEVDAVVGEAWSILCDPGRQQSMRCSLAEIPALVHGPGSFDRVAAGVLALGAGSSGRDEGAVFGGRTGFSRRGGSFARQSSSVRAISIESDRAASGDS
jgi:lipid-A-disaccharide synthase